MISLRIPKTAKGIVKRGVTELVTPGVSYNDLTYDSNKNNFLASVFVVKDTFGVSFRYIHWRIFNFRRYY